MKAPSQMTLTAVLTLRGYTHQASGDPGQGRDVMDAQTGEIVLPRAHWYEVWEWLGYDNPLLEQYRKEASHV